MFLEDDLSVQRSVMGQIRDTVRSVAEDTLNGVRTNFLTGRKESGNSCMADE